MRIHKRGDVGLIFLLLFLVGLTWVAGLTGCGARQPQIKEEPTPESQLQQITEPEERVFITRIDTQSLAGKRLVMIEADKPLRCSLFKSSNPLRLFLDFDRADFNFPAREIVVEDGFVTSIHPRYIPQRDLARVEIRFKQGFSHRLQRTGNRVVLELEKDTNHHGLWEGGGAQVLTATQSVQEKNPALEARPPKETEAEDETVPKFIGQRISLDFQNADITTILRIIADVSGLNIITSGEVTGRVTIRLIEVPWDQALDILLKNGGYTMAREGNIIRIGPPGLFQKEKQQELAIRKAREDAEELVTQTFPVNYAEVKGLEPNLQKILSPRGSLTVDERTNILIVKDLPKNIEEINFLIRTLDRQTPQVAIHAKILEVTKDFSKDFGVIWQAATLKKDGNDAQGTFDLGIPDASGVIDFAIDRIGAPLRARLDMAIQALEENRKLKVISAPKITTLDNKVAFIKTGKSIPFATSSAEGTQVELVDAVTSLSVTPHITPDGYISMKIEAHRDQPDLSLNIKDIAAAGIDKREVITEVIIRDSDTLVIGGLFKKTDSLSTRSVPYLSKIPILGWFFRNQQTSDDNEELLIFITPHIIPQAERVDVLS